MIRYRLQLGERVYVSWYNQHHRHSGIALCTLAQVHSGAWTHQWTQRNRVLQAYHAHPERFP